MDDDRRVRPARLPGRPLESGFTYLPEAEQEEFRRRHDAMMRRLAPVFREMDDCRRRAMARAHTYVIG